MRSITVSPGGDVALLHTDARPALKTAKALRRMRVVLVDDHALVREGLRELFSREHDLEVVGEAGMATDALSIIDATHPDGVVLDLSLGREMGFSLLAELRARHPDMALLVLSMHDEGVFAEVALANGANGYIGKHESSDVIVRALRRVLTGRPYVSEAVADRLLGGFSHRSGHSRGPESPVTRLTDREIDILRRIGLGRGTREIAADLRISAKTVETHRSRIKEKLEIKTAAELVVVAVNWLRDGFLDLKTAR